MDFVNSRLVGALDEHFINANVRRTAGGPDQCFSNVFGGKRNNSFVNFFSALSVTSESDHGEFGFGHAGINRADAHASAGKFQSERLGDFEFSGLGPAVSGAAFVSHMPGDGADV